MDNKKIATELVRLAKALVANNTYGENKPGAYPEGGKTVIAPKNAKVGDIGVYMQNDEKLGMDVYDFLIPGKSEDPSKVRGDKFGWAKIVKVTEKKKDGMSVVITDIAPYTKGEWETGGPSGKPRVNPFRIDGASAAQGDKTKYSDMAGKSIRLGDKIEVEYTSGPYGQTKTVSGILLGVDKYGSLFITNPSEYNDWLKGNPNPMKKVSVHPHWSSDWVGYWEHNDFEHGHTNHVKII